MPQDPSRPSLQALAAPLLLMLPSPPSLTNCAVLKVQSNSLKFIYLLLGSQASSAVEGPDPTARGSGGDRATGSARHCSALVWLGARFWSQSLWVNRLCHLTVGTSKSSVPWSCRLYLSHRFSRGTSELMHVKHRKVPSPIMILFLGNRLGAGPQEQDKPPRPSGTCSGGGPDTSPCRDQPGASPYRSPVFPVWA